MADKLKTTEAQRRASLKWEQANVDKITIKIRRDGSQDVTKAAIQAAAKRDRMSVNAWILDVIRNSL